MAAIIFVRLSWGKEHFVCLEHEMFSCILCSMMKSALYIVATPIGNLGDITLRALEVLKSVDLIAAEDTRHSRVLLSHYQINTSLTALHGDNEKQKASWLLEKILAGQSVALISDAGTPLISDPGAHIVSMMREHGVNVYTVPGPCAFVAAASVAGLSTKRLHFEGFLPHKGKERQQRLEYLCALDSTLVFYESCHRIQNFIGVAIVAFGPERQAVIARELTKQYETVLAGPLVELQAVLAGDLYQRKGEFVVLIAGMDVPQQSTDVDSARVARVLAAHLPTKQAAKLTAEITGQSQRDVYQALIQQKDA
jgi:16S rRNA (cytidine1402-2'-O)-methyltransferase